MSMKFESRKEAGAILAKRIKKEDWSNPLILALPRGGVPVASHLARKFDVPLNLLIVRKLGAPFQPEFALGALVEDGTVWINDPEALASSVSEEEFEKIKERERGRILEQKKKFRNGKELPDLRGLQVILVDDGIATGATVFAAVESLKKQGVAKIGVAVPVCASSTAKEIRALGVELVSVIEPDRLMSVGMWYRDFSQVEDEDVIAQLHGNPNMRRRRLAEQIADRLLPLSTKEDLAPLIAHLRKRPIVMLGEATHGTSEFYTLRSRISQFLIKNENYSFVAVEGDWPDSQKLNRLLRADSGRKSASQVMRTFKRWPTWMWSNREVAHFIESIKGMNVSFYGLDVYSLFESLESVIAYTMRVNPFLGNMLKQRYSCFEPFERDEYAYARSLQRFPEGCAAEVISNLDALLKSRLESEEKIDERFSAEQNARIVVNAENYYRALLSSDERSWNVRDGHMMETLDLLLELSVKLNRKPKGIVWAHNTHIGDYRATPMAKEGYVNLGGLARQTFGPEKVALVGFGTHSGRLVASNAWGGREQVLMLPPGREGTWEWHFHEALELKKWKQGYVLFEETDREGPFAEVLGHRAVGVVYHPGSEGRGNLVPTSLCNRYDAFVFIDETSALHSLHSVHEMGRFPETWPGGV
ncbi:MAG: erythromycin esterase family protein [Bdellovibrionales bacterium]|nr:erythromycin esterase family protein [Bdellovibrionales bacterium]